MHRLNFGYFFNITCIFGIIVNKASRSMLSSKTSAKTDVHLTKYQNITLFTMGKIGIIYRFLKCQFYFSYVFVKIANIRKYRKNDEYFPHSE